MAGVVMLGVVGVVGLLAGTPGFLNKQFGLFISVNDYGPRAIVATPDGYVVVGDDAEKNSVIWLFRNGESWSRLRPYSEENYTISRSESSPNQPILSINNLSQLCWACCRSDLWTELETARPRRKRVVAPAKMSESTGLEKGRPGTAVLATAAAAGSGLIAFAAFFMFIAAAVSQS